MPETSPGLIRVLRVLHRREVYGKSARISQDVAGTDAIDADSRERRCRGRFRIGLTVASFARSPVFREF